MNNIPYENDILDKMQTLIISANKRRRDDNIKEDSVSYNNKIVKKGIYKRYGFIKIDTNKVPNYIL
jgi:hypothetical protein